MPVVEGRLLGNPVTVLRDTGSNTVIVRRDLVSENHLTGKTTRVLLLDGTVKQLPEANIYVQTPYFVGEITAACMDQPIYDLVLGNIQGVREPHMPDPDWEHKAEDATSAALATTASKLPEDVLVSAVANTDRAQKGNRYVLTLIDFATLYPVAVALPAIDSAHVAEALIEMFSRIGIPKEIVTDQGASFTSELMREVSRLLSIKLLRTSPYHVMANGLVEKFNGTLKTMLKRLCQEKPRSWDRYIAPLLFAYREVPQASLGFSPFDLIYGRHVRGPLTVLKELWTKDDLDGEVRTTYGYLVDLRDRLEQTCKIAHEQLGKAKEKQKDYYDRKSRPRKLSVGNKVLILLPTDSNKLLMQWKGPFEITGKKNDVDYEISLGGKRKVFHVNMLKLYEERTSSPPPQASVAATIDDVPATPDDLDDPPSADSLPTLPLRQTQTCEDVKLSPELNAEQRAQVQEVIQKAGHGWLIGPDHNLRSVRHLQGATMAPPSLIPSAATPLVIRSNPRDPGFSYGTNDVDVEDWVSLYERSSGRLLDAKNELASRAQTSTEPYTAYILDILAFCHKLEDHMSEHDKVDHIFKDIADDAFNWLVCEDCSTFGASGDLPKPGGPSRSIGGGGFTPTLAPIRCTQRHSRQGPCVKASAFHRGSHG
ncbi:uncharacterized protein LOC144165718 [Haemaphysalis longicornis]